MTLYTFTGVIAIIALVLTLFTYFVKKPTNLLICYLQHFVGALFIYSGFLKGVDPIGFAYKLEEYFEVFAESTKAMAWLSSLMDLMHGYALTLSIFMIVLEMALGWLLIFGIMPRLTTWLILLLILFFTYLTGYSWYTGKITDCGCFGDAIKLTNAETFYKNIALTALILILFFFYRKITPVFSGAAGGIIGLIGVAASILLPVYCYNYLPLIDFRPYKVGDDIRWNMSIHPPDKPDSIVTKLVYRDKTNGTEMGYLMNEINWSDTVWQHNHEFVKQDSKVIRAGAKPKITDFKVWTDDNPDMTADVLDKPSFKLWIIAYDINKTNKAAFKDIVALANDCQKHNIPVVGLTATSYETTEPFRHEVQADFPFYYADGTVLKTMVRANPGIMLLNGSKVIGMWHYNSTPAYEELNKEFFQQQ